MKHRSSRHASKPRSASSAPSSSVPSDDPGGFLMEPAEVTSDAYPRLFTLPSGPWNRIALRATTPQPPEYVTVAGLDLAQLEDTAHLARWNMAWEAAQYRRRVQDPEKLPPPLLELAERGDLNVVVLPRSRSRYWEYAPLFHLLPAMELRRFGLPTVRAGQWPMVARLDDADLHLPGDFECRLGRAWASRIWRDLCSGSPEGAFTQDDPVRLLAHNLDFWIPPVTEVMQDLLRAHPPVGLDGVEVPAGPVLLEDGSTLPGADFIPARKGGDLWTGEAEAAEVVGWVVEQADADGRLRGILEAVRAHRVEEDFSARWSPAREDFERKLFRKRDKIKVRFVELDDTVAVQGPETEVVGDQVCADFLALLDPADRAVVVLLTRGTTKLGDIAEALGYANHSPVSKRLARIRTRAQHYFDNL